MIVFAREVFACVCPTDVPAANAAAHDGGVAFRRGAEADLARLDPAEHDAAHLGELRARLARGEHWLVGERGGEIVTYTWLHGRESCAYPSLPGCEFSLRADTAYGYDAWTPPALRGQGLRRRAFAAELALLGAWGRAWEGSFFVAHQLEGATRSLAEVGIRVVPLWRVTVRRDRTLAAERLADEALAAAMRPAFATG